jgi:hypothetical protein
MTSHVLKLLGCVVGFAIALTAGADAAQKTKKPRPDAPQMTAGNNTACRGANIFYCGPIYNSYDYLGNDPDPFIRSMIQRDLGAKYGPSD